jgi:sorting nexin-29
VYKILAAAVSNGLTQCAEHRMGEYQNGYRNNRATTDNICVMRQILEKCDECDIELYILYIDFKRAFDTLDRQKVIQTLQEKGIPNKLITLVKMTIHHTRASVIVENVKTDFFDVSTLVRQGDPLSSTLFNLVLDSVNKKTRFKGR